MKPSNCRIKSYLCDALKNVSRIQKKIVKWNNREEMCSSLRASFVLLGVWKGETKLQDLACVCAEGKKVHQDEATAHKPSRFLAWPTRDDSSTTADPYPETGGI